MCKNKLIIAAAGSGKTTFIINETLKNKAGKILVTTYTQANEEEIRKKYVKINKCIPSNVTVQTWFSFLLQHGVRPYQGCKYNNDITGLVLVNCQSAKGIPEKNTERHYFTATRKIYSDKLAKFVVKCNDESDNSVIDRISRIFTHIYIDEVQDLAGYDLEILNLLFNSKMQIILVGDPRQGTYSTNNSSKNKKYKKSKIIYFFEDQSRKIDTDDSSLTINYRSVKDICKLSNKLYPDMPNTTSGNTKTSGHDGVYLIRCNDVENYLIKYRPMQLYDSKKNKNINNKYPVMTFGKSKGLEFERVLIYPTQPFIEWLKDNNSELAPTSKAKFYVAITRASFSVGIVYDCNGNNNIDGILKYPKIGA